MVLIGHRNERANRRHYPHHLPCSTSIVAFHTGELVLERLGSLDAPTIARGRGQSRADAGIGEGARERIPVRRAARLRCRAAAWPARAAGHTEFSPTYGWLQRGRRPRIASRLSLRKGRRMIRFVRSGVVVGLMLALLAAVVVRASDAPTGGGSSDSTS